MAQHATRNDTRDPQVQKKHPRAPAITPVNVNVAFVTLMH